MGWFGLGKRHVTTSRPRLSSGWPAAVYAIGDIHGRLDLLRELEARIVEEAGSIQGEKLIVLLGDYVDRGSDSAGVLDHLLRPTPSGFTRITLAGNHEDLMLDFVGNPHTSHDWLRLGGEQTLQSYGLDTVDILNGRVSRRAVADRLASYIPDQHLALMRAMPVCLSLPGTVFVHAGIRRGVPLAEQTEQDMLWLRPDPNEQPSADGLLVVHGHTPAAEPYVSASRLCLDTGAFATGVLTAARLEANGLHSLISTGASIAAPRS